MKKKIIVSLLFFAILVLIVIVVIHSHFQDLQKENKEEKEYHYYKHYTSSDSASSSRAILRFNREILDLEENFVTLKDEDQSSIHMISRFGRNNKDYECTGSCYCEDDEDRRRIASGVSVLNKGMVYFLSAASTLLAVTKARDYFDNECKENFLENSAECSHVFSEVENCDDLSEKDEQQEQPSSALEEEKKHSVLFVCRGNICRSPMCECIFNELPKKEDWVTDSCATATDYQFWIDHVKGNPPDPRTLKILENHHGKGKGFEKLKSRGITEEDFENFEYILCMDDDNIEKCMKKLSEFGSTEKKKKAILKKITDFSGDEGVTHVPDPYKKELEDFEEVYQICKDCCEKFLKEVEG